MSGIPKSPPRVVKGNDLTFTPRFAYGDMAQVAQISGAEDGSKLGSGFVRMTNAKIPWTVGYDEIILVLEGELTISTDQGDLMAGPQDSIWLPTGTKLTYIAQNALLFYAIEPSDWAGRT